MRKDPLVIEWLDNFDRGNTIDAYLHGKTPEELIEEAEDEIKSGLMMRRRSIKRYLISFKKHLQDSGMSEYTVKNRLGGVKSFYQFYDIEIPKMKRGGSRPHTKIENLRVPSKEDMQDILKMCEPIEKAIVLAGASSGLSAIELCNLKIADFKNGYDPDTGITTLHIRRVKTRVDFITFFTPEASKVVLEYLDYRNRKPKTRKKEKMIALRKQRVTENSYLFIKQLVSPKYETSKDEEIQKLTSPLINQVYRSIVEKAGKNTGLNQWNYIGAHAVRKYFNSALLNAGADSFFTEFLMGHKLDQTQEAYFQAQPEKLKEIYKKFVPFLTIQKDLDISISKEYQEIRRENDILRAELENQIVTRNELKEIKYDVLKILTTTEGDVAEEKKRSGRDFSENLKNKKATNARITQWFLDMEK